MHKYLFALILFCAPTFLLADNAALQSFAKAHLYQRMVLLRGFYKDHTLRYDVSGAPLGLPRVGSWQSDAPVMPMLVSVSGNHLRITARRLHLTVTPECYDFTFDNSVEIELALHEGESVEEMSKAISAIFLRLSEDWAYDTPANEQAAALMFTELWRGEASAAAASTKASPDAIHQDAAAKTKASNKDPVNVPEGALQRGFLVKKVVPNYPPEARTMGVQGTVVARMLIDKSGAPTKIHVVRPLGYGLNLATVAALKQWRYKPYRINGEAIEVDTTITMNYSLSAQ